MITTHRGAKPGFSLIELLVVVTIIVILTTVGIVSFTSAQRNARNGKRKADMENIRSALVLYRSDVGGYPTQTTFDGMVTTLNTAGYFSNPSLTDPLEGRPGQGSYEYTPGAAGASGATSFEVCAYLETDGSAYCLSNP